LLALLWPQIARISSPTRLHAFLTETVAMLKDARSMAILNNRPVTAIFDARKKTIRAGQETVELPQDLDLAVTSGGTCRADGTRVEIVFRGDGTNCGALLRFARGRQIYRMRVNWLTGYVEVLEGD
jgi:general secretion pathway protein H